MPIFEVPHSVYLALSIFITNTSLEFVSIILTDNKLNKQKCDVLYRAVAAAKNLRTFAFINNTGKFDLEDNEYSAFDDHMKSFKSLPITTNIKWLNEGAL
jgi:hypothetical protein